MNNRCINSKEKQRICSVARSSPRARAKSGGQAEEGSIALICILFFRLQCINKRYLTSKHQFSSIVLTTFSRVTPHTVLLSGDGDLRDVRVHRGDHGDRGVRGVRRLPLHDERVRVVHGHGEARGAVHEGGGAGDLCECVNPLLLLGNIVHGAFMMTPCLISQRGWRCSCQWVGAKKKMLKSVTFSESVYSRGQRRGLSPSTNTVMCDIPGTITTAGPCPWWWWWCGPWWWSWWRRGWRFPIV